MDSIKPKKFRSKNFDEREKQTLLDMIEDYKNIIENKESNAASLKKKTEAWNELTSKFNYLMENKRSVKELRTFYDNLKKKARKNIAGKTCNKYRSDGGSPRSCVTETDLRVIAICEKDHLFPNTNKYDFETRIKDEFTEELPQINILEKERKTPDIITNTTDEWNSQEDLIHIESEECSKNVERRKKKIKPKMDIVKEKFNLIKLDFEAKQQLYELEKKLKLEQHEQHMQREQQLFDVNLLIKKRELEIKEIELIIKKKQLHDLNIT